MDRAGSERLSPGRRPRREQLPPRTDHGRSCSGTGGFAAPRWGAGERRGEAHFREDHSPAARPAWRYSSGARVPLRGAEEDGGGVGGAWKGAQSFSGGWEAGN